MPSYRLRGRVVLRGRAKDMCGRRGRDGGRGRRCCDGLLQAWANWRVSPLQPLEVMLKVALVHLARALSPRAERLPRSPSSWSCTFEATLRAPSMRLIAPLTASRQARPADDAPPPGP